MNIEIIKFNFLTRFECVLFDVKLHYTDTKGVGVCRSFCPKTKKIGFFNLGHFCPKPKNSG